MVEPDYFELLFRNCRVNALMQMNQNGHILRINAAFTELSGYTRDELTGKHFSILFTEQDRLLQKPAKELENVLQTGQGDDKNYFLHKSGQHRWVSGESILVDGAKGEKIILKIIQNIRQEKEFELSLERAGILRQQIV